MFLKLRKRYGRERRVDLFNLALSSEEAGLQKLRVFPMGFENTIVSTHHKQADEPTFEYTIAVHHASLLCKQLQEARKAGLCEANDGKGTQRDPVERDWTVLSVDVEGADAKVIWAAHQDDSCRWDVVSISKPCV